MQWQQENIHVLAGTLTPVVQSVTSQFLSYYDFILLKMRVKDIALLKDETKKIGAEAGRRQETQSWCEHCGKEKNNLRLQGIKPQPSSPMLLSRVWGGTRDEMTGSSSDDWLY
jgi:hypothetical protein